MDDVIQSDILSEEQIQDIVSGEVKEDTPVVLPSDEGKQEPTNEPEVKEVPTNIVDDFTKRYQENGGFTEQDYKDLEAKGYTREFVDTYVEGVQAKQIKEFESALSIYNTNMTEFNEAVKWASENWSKEQIETFNTAISTNDSKTQAFIAGSLIREAKRNTNTPEPQKANAPIHSNTVPRNTENLGYATKSDMLKDMSDSRYASDPAYRAKVEAKLIATDTKQWYTGLPRGD